MIVTALDAEFSDEKIDCERKLFGFEEAKYSFRNLTEM